MTRETVLSGLTAINLVLLAGIWATQILPATAQGDGILRGNGLEIVDAEGRLRASITLQPPAGEATETALFRLINAAGQPSLKLSASATGAGLSFVGGDDASYVILQADGPDTELRMVEQGKERVIVP